MDHVIFMITVPYMTDANLRKAVRIFSRQRIQNMPCRGRIYGSFVNVQ